MKKQAEQLSLGETLQRARTKRGLSLREAARTTGIHFTSLQQIENGRNQKPSPEKLKALADLFEMKFDELLRSAGYSEADRGVPKRSSWNHIKMAEMLAAEKVTPLEFAALMKYLSKMRE